MTIPGYCVNNTSNLRLQFPHLQLGEFTDYLGGWFILLMVGDLGLRIQPVGLILNCGNPPHPALFLPEPAQERGKPHNETKEKTTKTKEGQGVSRSSLNHRWQSRYFKEKDIGKKKETKEGIKEKEERPPPRQGLHEAQGINMTIQEAFFLSLQTEELDCFMANCMVLSALSHILPCAKVLCKLKPTSAWHEFDFYFVSQSSCQLP